MQIFFVFDSMTVFYSDSSIMFVTGLIFTSLLIVIPF